MVARESYRLTVPEAETRATRTIANMGRLSLAHVFVALFAVSAAAHAQEAAGADLLPPVFVQLVTIAGWPGALVALAWSLYQSTKRASKAFESYAPGLNKIARFNLDPRDKRDTEDYYELVGDDDGVFGCMSLLGCEDICPKSLPLAGQIAYLRRKMVEIGLK